jgi:hypothetical protein
MKLDLNLLEFDLLDEYIKSAKYFGVVETSGGWVKLPGEEKSIRPRELRERLVEDISLKNQIREEVLTRAA